MEMIGIGLALGFIGLIFLVAILAALEEILSDLPFAWSKKLVKLRLFKLSRKLFKLFASGYPH